MGFFDWLSGLDKNIGGVLIQIIKACAVILLALALYLLGKSVIKRIITKKQGKKAGRAGVFLSIGLSVWKYAVIIVAVFQVLDIIGLRVTANSLLATAGIGGVAIGIGAQDSIRDVLSGITLIMEDQVKIGDYIKVDSYEGSVESMTLRVTHVRAKTGELYMIPNGTIKTVVNYSR